MAAGIFRGENRVRNAEIQFKKPGMTIVFPFTSRAIPPVTDLISNSCYRLTCRLIHDIHLIIRQADPQINDSGPNFYGE